MEYKDLCYGWVNDNTIIIMSDKDENKIEIPNWCYKAKCLIENNNNNIVKWFNVKVENNNVIFNVPLKGKITNLLSLYIDEYEFHKLKVSYTNTTLNQPVEPVIDDGLNEKINHLETEIKKLNTVIGFLKSEIKLIRDNCGL